MKKSIIAIFSFALVGFSSCENAANKIKDGEVDTTLLLISF